MPLQPSRRDTIGPPPRNVSDLASLVRHHGSAIRQMEQGLLGGRFATLRPTVRGGSQLVGGDAGGDVADNDILFSNTDTLTAGAGDVVMHLTHLPEDGSEHVFWQPNGGGGIDITQFPWSRVDQDLTIPAFTGQAAGDVYSCKYAYYQDEVEPIAPSLVGVTSPGVVNGAGTTTTFGLPVGTAAGDLLVLTVRGVVAAGGGDVVTAISCADSRMTLAYSATALNSGHVIIASTWVGIATSSTSPIVVASTSSGCKGNLAAITGANGWGTPTAVESGTATPTVAGTAAVAAVWIRSSPFGSVTAAAPTGYTDIATSGADYYSADLGLWYDPNGTTSPVGTFNGEGCCVIPII